MLKLALQGMRTRWVTFIGSFIALALGVGLIATTGLALAATFSAPDRGPERLVKAPVVVKTSDLVRADTPIGERTQTITDPAPVPAAVTEKLAALGKVVEDRSFPVSGPGLGEDTVGHPWSVAALTPYTLTAGRAPSAPGETVATGDALRPGTRVQAATARGSERITVVGTVASAGFEKALFFTDAEAARLSPDVDAVAVHAPADRVEAAVGAGFDVLTGDERRRADPDPDRDEEALVSVNALLGTAAGVTGFVSVFVVASTFSFAVAQRRREFGLLRTAGATPSQVRRMVFTEAFVIGVLASAAGCRLGAAGAPRLAAWMADAGIAPAWFRIGEQSWPLHTAFWTGLFVALSGVVVSSWRAGRVGPTEALRESAVDARAMPVSRWLIGGAVLATGLGLLFLALLDSPGDVLKRKTYITQPMLLIVGFALFAPVLVKPLTRLLTWLPARLPGATGMLARENASAGVRRTAAVAAPVIITVALAASLMGTTATISEAKAGEAREQITADLVATAGGEGRALPDEFVRRAGAVPGVTVSATRSTGVTVLEGGVALVKSEAKAVDPKAHAAVSHLPVVAGRLADLDDDSIVVNEEWLTTKVGDTVSVWLGNGRTADLRIAAVLSTGTGSNGVYLTERNAAGAPVDRVDLALPRDGADSAAAALGAAAKATGVQLLTGDRWVEVHHPRSSENTRLGLWMILGIALVYTGIALTNTLMMATSDRVRDLASLRLTGATKGQVLRLVGVEALVVVAVGAVLGAVIAGVNLLGVWSALGLLDVWSDVVVPWGTVAAVIGASALLATVASVLPASFALRVRPVELAGMRE
ncbi:FtsX-like permease family protein [Streptomyces sp. CS014]|uniref:ABC transporter permease n=1 Tax=Streptomyces sp. CS014 TaxID=2162707 RepID=UPI000D51004F|nr:FtsX-like permease family protein [Streptomyces sp. CS014]PVC99228.1 ABC transporter permease [Streptomyces sp. CS014]